MAGPKIIGILFLVLVLGAGLFILRSGVINKAVTSLSNLTPNSSTSTSQFAPTVKFPNPFRGSLAPPPPPPSQFVGPPPAQAPPPPPPPRISPYEIPAGYSENDLSPNFHKVRIGGVSPGSDFYYGQITLYANLSGSERVDITDWLLQARDGSQYIPRAVEIYDPRAVPVESDISLKAGDQVFIYSSRSAVGQNLRLNKCTGYLENNDHFTPPLPLDCPYIDRSEVSSFSGECQDYILSLGGCRLPDASPPVPDTDYACRSFLDTINQRGCFERHRSDPDFLSREIRVWTGSRFLDERHDQPLLLDKQRLIVDAYSY